MMIMAAIMSIGKGRDMGTTMDMKMTIRFVIDSIFAGNGGFRISCPSITTCR